MSSGFKDIKFAFSILLSVGSLAVMLHSIKGILRKEESPTLKELRAIRDELRRIRGGS